MAPRRGHALLQRKRDPNGSRYAGSEPQRTDPHTLYRLGRRRIHYLFGTDHLLSTVLSGNDRIQREQLEQTAHTPLTFSVKANQQNNTSGFTIRYELLQGAGDMYYGGIKLSDGQSLTSGSQHSLDGH